MVVSDAGPGTGKTTTIVRRYINILCNEERPVPPEKILMVTFTNNSANEMGEKIRKEIMRKADEENDKEKKKILKSYISKVKTTTFDSLCYKILLNSPDKISDFFKINETLSRNAKLVDNDTLNKQFFYRYYLEFISNLDNSKKYAFGKGSPAIAMEDEIYDLYYLISNLMCRGIIPLHNCWFADGEKILLGNPKEMERKIYKNEKKLKDTISDFGKNPDSYILDEIEGLSQNDIVIKACGEDRKLLCDFIHDLYFGFIRKSVSENRLTFGLTAIFAYAILYNDEYTRKINKVDYMMVDEFQDTNNLQMRICLLLLDKPNLCAVGDWKQSIYKFRYADERNITEFEDRVDYLITKLNRDEKRIPFKMVEIKQKDLKINYRSSPLILEKAFDTLTIKGSKNGFDEIENQKIVYLEASREEEIGEFTDFELLKTENKEDIVPATVTKIIEYVTDPKYKIVEDGIKRPVTFKDIAVLSRNCKEAIAILNECLLKNVPAFYQGELEIMSTREGKLALAWLRYVNNSSDRRGLTTILVDKGFSLNQINDIIRNESQVESKTYNDIKEYRNRLTGMKRRPNLLITSIFAFYDDLNEDITQSIINILSSAHSGTLSTISDLIDLITDDIKNQTRFDIEQTLQREAVTIQTLHKSKGLEYPIVIIPKVDSSSFPSTKTDMKRIVFDDDCGIRLKKEYYTNVVDGKEMSDVYDSWKWKIVSCGKWVDYSQERRLFFVGISRAKQYITLIASDKASTFFNHYVDKYEIEPRKNIDLTRYYLGSGKTETDNPPVFQKYNKRKKALSVHDVMDTYANIVETSDYSPDNNREGRGKDYGTKVHQQAYMMGRGRKPTEDFEDLKFVQDVLDGIKDAEKSFEIKCVYPVSDDVVIRGVIDVLAVFPDRIEIHDYKTDNDNQFILQYELQLSIYAMCVQKVFGNDKKIECYIDFVSPKYFKPENRKHKVDILPEEKIREIITNKIK